MLMLYVLLQVLMQNLYNKTGNLPVESLCLITNSQVFNCISKMQHSPGFLSKGNKINQIKQKTKLQKGGIAFPKATQGKTNSKKFG